jgi:hypothetical protein
MGISIQSIGALEADLFDVMAKGQIVLVKFQQDADMMGFIGAINKVLADVGKPPLMLKK